MFRRVLQPSEIRQLHSDPLAPFRQRRFTPTYSPVAEEAAATTSVGWTRSLTPSPVRPSYKSGFARSAAESAYPGLWKNLSGAWCPALGNTGTTIHNRSPDSGIPDCSLTNTEAGDWQVGPYGHEIAFDGVNEYGNIVYHERLKPGTLSWSVAYAAYLPDANAEAPVYAYRMSSSPWKQIQFGFGTILSNGTLSTSKKIYIVIYAGGSEKYFANTDDDIADGAWHSVVFVRDCNEDVCRIYVDGEEKSITIASVAGTGLKSDVDTNLPTQWGRNNTSSYLQYDWATGFVWKRALEGSEAKVLGVDPLAPFRQRRFTPTISGAAEAAAGWQPYWAPRMTQRIIGSGVR